MEMRDLLRDTMAHVPPARLLEDLSEADAIRRVPAAPHSITEIVAHLDFWQSWFLKRCAGKPEPMAASAALGWPAVPAGSWEAVRGRFLGGLEQAVALADQPGRLDQAITPAIELPELGSYVVRDALIHMATHNSHHLGQIVTLRQLMGLWPPRGGGWTW